MTISKEVSRLEKSSVKLDVCISKDDILVEYEDMIKEYTKSVQLPGFRKGKVPKEVLIRKFGDALLEEALGKIIDKSMGEILDDESFPRESRPLPYSRPVIQDEPKLDLSKDLNFSVVYDVLPEVKISKWEGLEVEIPNVSIEDEDLNKELEIIRDRNSIVLDKDEGQKAEKGDVLTINYYELNEAGEVIENAKREDFIFTLGSNSNIYQFDDEIDGMKKGETKEFSKTYTESDNNALAGKTVKLKVELTALKIKKLPDLDDDLAQDVDEKFKTLDDLKNSIKERLNRDLENRLKSLKINGILEKIMENTPVEIPESMLNMELESRWRNLARRFGTDPAQLRNIMENSEQGLNPLIEEWKPDALKALHSRLIVETLMEQEKLDASDEEVEKEFEKLSLENGAAIEEVKKYYEEERMMDYLKEDIKEQKVYDIIIGKNTIKKGKKEKYADLVLGKQVDKNDE